MIRFFQELEEFLDALVLALLDGIVISWCTTMPRGKG